MFFKQNFCCFLLSFLVFTSPQQVLSREITPSCTLAARVFGKEICLNDVAIEQEQIDSIKKESGDQGLDSGEALREKTLERLKEKIWNVALSHKFSSDILEPTAEELDLYNKAMKNSLEENYRKNRQTAEKVEKMLAQGRYNGQEKIKLANLLQTLETSISFYEERENYKQDMPQEFHDMVLEAERGLAQTMIAQWKADKALWDAYGGRVIFQQGALEPVDAYKKFMAYIRQEGKLEIPDPQFGDVFGIMERYIAINNNVYLAPDDPAVTDYFSSLSHSIVP